LLCDVGERAIATDRPAVVLLGGRLTGRHFWSDCAEYLGLAQIGGEALLGGMRAAAEAAGVPFLLLVDALNESAEPSAWRDELPGLLAELDDDPWIALGVSVRSTLVPVVLPDEGLGDAVAEVEHPGFQGRELEACERFFDAFGLEQPRVPLLTPEFTNPLFLKLYCEGLKQLGLSAPPAGEAHISDVFARHLEWRAKRITSTLRLDAGERRVERAIDRFAHAVAWDDDFEPVEVVRFVYQRFADYRIASALIEPFDSAGELEKALATGQPLRDKIAKAPLGWIEALSVLVPERLGVELLDATNWRFPTPRRQVWDRALVRSVVTRRPEAVGDRARALFAAAEKKSRYLNDAVFDAVLSVAAIPDHPLNADHVHRVLARQPMADRDAWWGIRTYYALGDEGPLDRLIRWAARGPYRDCPDDVLRLAATILAWTLTSPNRYLRDYVTKALRQMLASRPDVLRGIVSRFADVDDVYVTERLAIIAHATLLTDGTTDPDRALELARELRDSLLVDETVPNVLLRDAVRGSFEWALHSGLIEQPEYDALLPPYSAAPPAKPRTKKQLESRRRTGGCSSRYSTSGTSDATSNRS
jgi:hypothetical protein